MSEGADSNTVSFILIRTPKAISIMSDNPTAAAIPRTGKSKPVNKPKAPISCKTPVKIRLESGNPKR